jgi:FMN phosphatase YigB (HAD superfamily)
MAASIKYKAVIFDLDDTLFDTSRLCVLPAAREAFAAMIEAGLQGTVDDLNHERVKFEHQRPGADFIQHVVEKFGLRPGNQFSIDSIAEIGRTRFSETPVNEKIFVYSGVREMLGDLHSRYMIFLVTLGDPEIQTLKVRLLKIEGFFNKIFYLNKSLKQTKTEAFGKILATTGFSPEEYLCIGNRLDLEIAQAKALGMDTCFVQTERHRQEPVTKEEQPDYKVHRISEIMRVCRLS